MGVARRCSKLAVDGIVGPEEGNGPAMVVVCGVTAHVVKIVAVVKNIEEEAGTNNAAVGRLSGIKENFLKEGSAKDYELNFSMYGNAAKLEKQIDAKLAWLMEKYYYRSQESVGCSSSQADLYLTKKELHQLHLDEEALRETLEEQAIDEKAREEKIRQKQADDDEFFMEFGVVRYDSEYESSD
ncbi:hypothetical protein Tco_0723176 [Tanacetum coccineum]